MVYLLAALVILEALTLKMAAGIYLGYFVFVAVPLGVAAYIGQAKK